MARQMAGIRIRWRDADFAEVAVWMPKENIRELHDWTWDRLDCAGRCFSHGATGSLVRREGKRR
ncbi:hypothetical protein [Pukyongiella litopenaei]|uniref:hypothetical protein n=1 Tax=Pukyongiella litopenaei TaxID=2605946 RepID=UPI001B80C0E0|nr:hypothetical protein [Pukyongiella litopenaei]